MQQLSRNDFNAVIENSPFAKLSEDLRQALFEIHRVHHYHRNQEVFRSHASGKKIYLVADGCFKLFLKNGKTKLLKRGKLFGEVAALTDHERLGSVTGGETESSLITFSTEDLIARHLIPDPGVPDVISELFSNTVSYLHELLDNSTETLILNGEDEKTEFKEGAHNPNIIKSIAAFLNTQGGTLLIGVNDDGEVIGVPEYSNRVADKYDQDLQNLIREKLGSEAMSFVHFCHSEFNGKGVYRIDCVASDRPVYALIGKGVSSESFIIRSGSTNQILGFGAAIQYIARRFPGELLRKNGVS